MAEYKVRNCIDLGVNAQKIVRRLLANQNLLKLLYYTDKDPLSHEDLTQEQIQNEVFEKYNFCFDSPLYSQHLKECPSQTGGGEAEGGGGGSTGPQPLWPA